MDGDRLAFGMLVRRYQHRIYYMIARHLGNSEDARDVVQDAFLTAYRALGSFRGDSSFFTWLCRIALNAAANLKRKKRLAIARIETACEDELAFDPPDRSESSRPGQAIERAEQERFILQALASLCPEHRAVLVMRDMEGRNYRSIAKALGVPIGTIRSRLHRARLELRDWLDRHERRTVELFKNSRSY
jgi:RNA polymerase sigma-70 factor (ECF subfamily)